MEVFLLHMPLKGDGSENRKNKGLFLKVLSNKEPGTAEKPVLKSWEKEEKLANEPRLRRRRGPRRMEESFSRREKLSIKTETLTAGFSQREGH